MCEYCKGISPVLWYIPFIIESFCIIYLWTNGYMSKYWSFYFWRKICFFLFWCVQFNLDPVQQREFNSQFCITLKVNKIMDTELSKWFFFRGSLDTQWLIKLQPTHVLVECTVACTMKMMFYCVEFDLTNGNAEKHP